MLLEEPLDEMPETEADEGFAVFPQPVRSARDIIAARTMLSTFLIFHLSFLTTIQNKLCSVFFFNVPHILERVNIYPRLRRQIYLRVFVHYIIYSIVFNIFFITICAIIQYLFFGTFHYMKDIAGAERMR